MAKFLAWYEDAAKVEAAAKARGFTGEAGTSWHDFVEAEHEKFITSRSFPTLALAVGWLTDRCRAAETFFGCGTIRKMEPRRCSACTCGGLIATREWTVADEGVEQEDALDSPCYWEDE